MDNTRLDQGILGIDAGGTFTDLAFISGTELDVEAWAKTPTRHNDLLSTIEDGLKEILEKIEPERIKGVNLATTLATNAIVENKIRPTGLILIGYDADQVETALKLNKFGTKKCQSPTNILNTEVAKYAILIHLFILISFIPASCLIA